jgi:hypothetical protein
VPAPGYSTPMPFTAAIARTFRTPALLSTITQLIDFLHFQAATFRAR